MLETMLRTIVVGGGYIVLTDYVAWILGGGHWITIMIGVGYLGNVYRDYDW